MTSLLKLADTKANKPGMNLMHYVAKVRRSPGMHTAQNVCEIMKNPAIMSLNANVTDLFSRSFSLFTLALLLYLPPTASGGH